MAMVQPRLFVIRYWSERNEFYLFLKSFEQHVAQVLALRKRFHESKIRNPKSKIE
jgi:hypothetical protein